MFRNRIVESLTSNHLKLYVKPLVKQENDLYVPAVINNAQRGIRFTMNIAHAEVQITFYCSDFFTRLDTVGSLMLRPTTRTKP